MPQEILDNNNSKNTTEQGAEQTDLLSKELFDSGIEEFELSIHSVESNLVISNGLLLELELLEQSELKGEINYDIEKDQEVLKVAKQQLVLLYLNLVRILDHSLLGALREHVIRGVNSLDQEGKMRVLDEIIKNKK